MITELCLLIDLILHNMKKHRNINAKNLCQEKKRLNGISLQAQQTDRFLNASAIFFCLLTLFIVGLKHKGKKGYKVIVKSILWVE